MRARRTTVIEARASKNSLAPKTRAKRNKERAKEREKMRGEKMGRLSTLTSLILNEYTLIYQHLSYPYYLLFNTLLSKH